MLRVSEQWHGSDVGRQRQGNEDNLFVRAPLFVVADGMGGAQAGEVASQLAVEAFEPGLPDGAPAEQALEGLIREANERIHSLSRADAEHSGMGTTCTAIYVAEREVALAHVGDSRCYLYRDGELVRLTRDHSLVGELVDRGKLTEEQAEMHPQRSVITRALGPEPQVEVDTDRVEAREGDVFLLCSDGLTSMVREAALVPLLAGARSLEEVGRALIGAANDAGGRDNITVVLIRVEDVEVSSGALQETAEVASVSVVPEAAPEPEPEEPEPVPEPEAPPETSPRPRPATSAPPAAARAATHGKGPKRRRRLPGGLIFALVVLVIVGVSAWTATRAIFFVGVGDRRTVTVFRGLPYELPGGVNLYSRHYASGVTIDQVPAARRATFTENKLRSLDDASDLVRQAELGKLSE